VLQSTFAEALQRHIPRFVRCNQDDLGNRKLVENLARQLLRAGSSVCVDRTNFDESQRSHWINIAHEFPGTSIWVLVFDTPYDVCAARLQNRMFGHPTIHNPAQGLSVLSNFSSMFQFPSPREGYDHLISLRPDDHRSPTYSHGDIVSILHRLRDSPLITSPQ
ncbi:hypothetical protein JAAARDRAFT_99271, partial [Jaapia argillacea MUCL 33604]